MKFPFSEMPLSKEVKKSIEEMGFEEATSIQGEAIPPLLEGRDVIGQSRTGTGKTIAFAVPAVEKVDPSSSKVQALILCPTRELCIQVSEEVMKLGKHRRGLKALPIYGGQSYDRQFQGLERGAQIVIGTPGRLIDHLGRGTLKLDAVNMVILDEADEMLDMGFQEDLERILEEVPEERQTVLFSATMAPGIRRLADRYLNDPQVIRATSESVSVPAIEQAYMEVHGPLKLEALARVLDLYGVKLAIVFCNTRIGVDELVAHLQARGYSAEGLHGDHKQVMRDRIMNKFRSGKVEVLVATDVASRGIDVKDVELVVNYDLPKDEEDYVHRIGRTGRAGRKGRALSFASGRDLFRLRGIERFIKKRIDRMPMPTLAQIEAVQHEALLDRVRETLKQGGLERQTGLVETLLKDDGVGITDIACALLKMMMPESAASGPDPAELLERGRRDGEGRGPREGGAGRPMPGRGAAGGWERRDREGTERDGYPPREQRAKSRPGAYPSPDFEPAGPMVPIVLNVGRVQGAGVKDILGAVTGETGLPGRAFGAIRLSAKHSVVEVVEGGVAHVLERLQGARVKGVPLKPDLFKGPRRRDPREED